MTPCPEGQHFGVLPFGCVCCARRPAWEHAWVVVFSVKFGPCALSPQDTTETDMFAFKTTEQLYFHMSNFSLWQQTKLGAKELGQDRKRECELSWFS